MKFGEFNYERIPVDGFKEKQQTVLAQIEAARDKEELLSAIVSMDKLEKDLAEKGEIAQIHHTLDTADAFWAAENAFYDEALPQLQEGFANCWKAIKAKPFRADVPAIWYELKEREDKTFSPEIIPLLQEENRLASLYQETVAKGKVILDGKEYALSEMDALLFGPDRDMRRRAMEVYWGWYAENEQILGDIYSSLVKVRTDIAKTLGFENFVPLGYLRMGRIGYGPEDIQAYRKQIVDTIVPFDNALYKTQGKRLGLETLAAWDEKVPFAEGIPTPATKDLIPVAQKMYSEMDPETGAFFEMMANRDLLDLDARKNKAGGGYCTYIPNVEAPFVFANSNGTSQDVETLTHEIGHAFQAWRSKDLFPFACVWPGMESCEIHSMSMEFFAWPWMKDFFADKELPFRIQHLEGAFKFLPYGALVDHFQEEVYSHPEWDQKTRMETWRNLEKMYLPNKDYTGIPILEAGGWWMKQGHIFMDPFYYIDYTLAQHAALQFWVRLMEQDGTAFSDYLRLCDTGGTKPFLELLETGHLQNPFVPGSFEPLVKTAKNWLDSVA